MNTEAPYCQNELRRHEVRAQELNGIDYVEVSEDQLRLTVYFLGKAPSVNISNVQIRGGQRIRDIRVTDLRFCRQDDPEIDDCIVVTVDKPGDFSMYELCLVELDESGKPTQIPYHEMDPRYACVEFSFKLSCPSDLDCKQPQICPPQPLEEPDINYLAKDYASFRQLMLDRLALIMPEWKERHVPDIGIALVEVLAYVGDHLSYYQDAVATEAYLDTARQRISVRRHARLVDYRMHEGCNARAWLHINTSVNHILAVNETYFVTRHASIPQDGRVLTTNDLTQIAASEYEVFEPLIEAGQDNIQLWQGHNEIEIYTWGDSQCCLPKGTMSATLKDEFITIPGPDDSQENDYPAGAAAEPEDQGQQQKKKKHAKTHKLSADDAQLQRKLHLQPGDFLLFEEIVDPKTGNPADRNPSHRHVIRLTRVTYGLDELYQQPIVEISWSRDDALPFPLCISSQAADCTDLDKVSVARGNIVLVDHGRRNENEPLGKVPEQYTQNLCPDRCDPADSSKSAGSFRPVLHQPRLTFREPLPNFGDAAQLLRQHPQQSLPAVTLTSNSSDSNSEVASLWTPQLDLLESYPDDHHFVIEMDDDRRAHVRFGDGELGYQPEAETEFSATYRTGNGSAGNVGAEAISQVVQRHSLISGITLRARNPMPASGGTDPEPSAEVKLFAPHAFRQSLQRAVIAEDYAQIVLRDFADEVQRAAASLRWTGSWYEVLVAIDPFAAEQTEPELSELIARINGHLHRYRRMGHDLRVAVAQYVPLDIELLICVKPDYLRGHVKAALLDGFSNRELLNGEHGFFHPDNLTFGEGIYLSDLVASAQAVTGVQSVEVKKLQRLYEANDQAIIDGVLKLGPLEVPRLDNDPNFPENGKLVLNVGGGR
jgi:hypothetical protein